MLRQVSDDWFEGAVPYCGSSYNGKVGCKPLHPKKLEQWIWHLNKIMSCTTFLFSACLSCLRYLTNIFLQVCLISASWLSSFSLPLVLSVLDVLFKYIHEFFDSGCWCWTENCLRVTTKTIKWWHDLENLMRHAWKIINVGPMHLRLGPYLRFRCRAPWSLNPVSFRMRPSWSLFNAMGLLDALQPSGSTKLQVNGFPQEFCTLAIWLMFTFLYGLYISRHEPQHLSHGSAVIIPLFSSPFANWRRPKHLPSNRTFSVQRHLIYSVKDGGLFFPFAVKPNRLCVYKKTLMLSSCDEKCVKGACTYL